MKREFYIIMHEGGEERFDFKPIRSGKHNKDLSKENQTIISKRVKEVDGYRMSGWAIREVKNDI